MRKRAEAAHRLSARPPAHKGPPARPRTHTRAHAPCERYTAAWLCMAFCMSSRMDAVERAPPAWRSLSRLAIDASPASLGSSGCAAPGLAISAMRSAVARPKTTMSSSELAPRRLAPCTDAHAASPAANRPGTMASGLPAVGLITSPRWFVGTPPML